MSALNQTTSMTHAATSDAPPSIEPKYSGPVVHLYVAGVGAVGRALLQQLDRLPSRGLPLRLLGCCTSQVASWFVPESYPPLRGRPARVDEPTDWPRILRRLIRQTDEPVIFVDTTGDPEVARLYPRLLRADIHVVTSSKHGNTFEQRFFDELEHLVQTRAVHYRYETTVGAGLPVVRVVQDLRATGDRIVEIQGAASGTLTFLFSTMEQGRSFSEAVREAIERGYTEPDVRDDLSGEDVVRKFMILARAAGYRVERDHVTTEPLIPDKLATEPRRDVLGHLQAYDDPWQRRLEEARRRRAVLRYAGRLVDGHITVGVQAVAHDSPLGRLSGTDNLFEIRTERYATSPIVVQGPGAGPQVTAAGVLADILTVARAVTGHVRPYPTSNGAEWIGHSERRQREDGSKEPGPDV